MLKDFRPLTMIVVTVKPNLVAARLALKSITTSACPAGANHVLEVRKHEAGKKRAPELVEPDCIHKFHICAAPARSTYLRTMAWQIGLHEAG